MDFEYKYNKYKSKYLKLKGLLSTYESSGFLNQNMEGGSKNKKKYGDHIFSVNCVEVIQDKKDNKFKGIMCKTPPIKINFDKDTVKLNVLTKSLVRLINKRIPMKYVTEVIIKQQDKHFKVDGDKLSNVDVILSNQTIEFKGVIASDKKTETIEKITIKID